MDSALTDYELEKVKNRFESSVVLSNTSILNKAMNLSMYELLGDPDLVNREVESYRAVSREMVKGNCNKIPESRKLHHIVLPRSKTKNNHGQTPANTTSRLSF